MPEHPTARSIAASRVRGGLAAIRRQVDSAGRPTRRAPVVDMIEVSVRTRPGCRAATVCAIMPPIETPTRWALVAVERVEQAGRVGGHVGEVVLLGGQAPRAASRRGRGGRKPRCVDEPASRLSKRTTR